jgi:prepilin-type N-terminal cleavage/methylation domain-containing protein
MFEGSPDLKMRHSREGFTLVELLMVISLLAIISVGSITFVGNLIQNASYQQTLHTLLRIRNALLGDPELKTGRFRSDFGFLGDCGSLPTAGEGLNALLTRPLTRPAFTVDGAVRFGVGWNGPYLKELEPGIDALKDAWGNAFLYDTASVPRTVSSLGSDGAVGGTGFARDIVITLPSELQSGTLYGFITDGGTPYAGAVEVELHSLDSTSTVVNQNVILLAPDKGAFKFTSVPLGKRSITIYSPNSVAPVVTRGPYIVTVESAHHLIPVGSIDLTN